MPQHAFGEHHSVGEHRARVVAPVPVDVLQAENAVRALLKLLSYVVVRPRRLGNVQAAPIVHVDDDRPLDQRGTGGDLDFETVRYRNLVQGARAEQAAAKEGNRQREDPDHSILHSDTSTSPGRPHRPRRRVPHRFRDYVTASSAIAHGRRARVRTQPDRRSSFEAQSIRGGGRLRWLQPALAGSPPGFGVPTDRRSSARGRRISVHFEITGGLCERTTPAQERPSQDDATPPSNTMYAR